MYKPKTTETRASVQKFLDAVADETKRADSWKLVEMMAAATGAEPKMWGPSIVGFGNHHYKYESGHEGDTCLLGFSPRKAAISIYVSCQLDRHAKLLAKLGKHSAGKGCLYVKRLADIDLKVLEALMAEGLAEASRGK
jgi:hypothetical protein